MLQYLGEPRYWVLLAAAFVEGPVTSFVAGALIASGVFNPFVALGVLVFKDLFLDTVFYAIGCLARFPFLSVRMNALRAKTGLGDHVLKTLEQEWCDHPVRLMWIGKLAYGLSLWFLVSAGMAGIQLKKFYLYTLPVSAFQFGVLMVLGYFLGISMWNGASWIFITIQLTIAGGAVFFVLRIIARYMRKHYVET